MKKKYDSDMMAVAGIQHWSLFSATIFLYATKKLTLFLS